MTRLPTAAAANRPGGFQGVKIFITQKRIGGARQPVPAGWVEFGNPIHKTKLIKIHTLHPSGVPIEPPNGHDWEVLLSNPNEIHYYLHIEINHQRDSPVPIEGGCYENHYIRLDALHHCLFRRVPGDRQPGTGRIGGGDRTGPEYGGLLLPRKSLGQSPPSQAAGPVYPDRAPPCLT